MAVLKAKGDGIGILGVVHFLLQLQFWFPIWVIFLLHRGFTLSQIALADALFRAGVVILEFPLGVVSDWLGRKKTYLLAAVMAFVAYGAMTLIDSVFFLLLCWLLWAVYEALLSGTDSAYCYELLHGSNREEEAPRIFGYFSAVASAAFLISHGLAGFLYALDSNLPIIVNAGAALLSALIILTLPDPSEKVETPSFQEVLRQVWNQCRYDQASRSLLLLLALLSMFHWSLILLFQPFLLTLNLSIETIGLVFMGFSFLGIVGGVVTGPLTERLGEKNFLFASIFIQVVALVITACFFGWWGVGGLALFRLSFYLYKPVLEVMIHRRVDSSSRAALVSFVSLLSSLLMIGTRPLLGLIGENSLLLAFGIWAGVGLALFPLALYLIKRALATS